MWWSLIIVFIASIPLAVKMARERGRSPKFWFWIAFIVGPLAPLMHLLLGQAKRSLPAN
jgi:ABC-type microcin C transport system permease subunit YejB